MSAQGKVSVIDSTVRLEWEMTKEDFDKCEFKESIKSPVYNVHTGSGEKQSKWKIKVYPKGDKEKNKDQVKAYLHLKSKNESYKVRFEFAVKTPTGYWPTDFVEDLYAINCWKIGTSVYGQNNYSWGRPLCSTKEFSEMFTQNRVTVVVTMAIYIEGENYLKHMDMAEDFMRNMRSMPNLDMFYDVTVICGDKEFKSNKALLASSSWVFRRMLETDMTEKIKNEINITDAKPEIIEDLLDYLSNGLIPEDFDTKAVELIHVAEKYDLEALLEACENSLANNLSVETVIDTLITVDLYVPKSEHREKILDFINSKAAEVIKTKDWMKFVKNYPELVTELYLHLASTAGRK